MSNLIVVGQELAAFYNNQGNLARRLLIWTFKKRPDVVDTTLPQRILNDLPKIIVSFNRAYLALVRESTRRFPDTKEVSPLLPQYFKNQEIAMAGERNTLQAALHHEEYFVFAVNKALITVYCPQQRFWDVYHRYCTDNRIRPEPPSKALEQVLVQYNIYPMKSRTGRTKCYRQYPRQLVTGPHRPKSKIKGCKFYVGVDVAPRHAWKSDVLGPDARLADSLPFDPARDYQPKPGDLDEDVDMSVGEDVWDYDVFWAKADQVVEIVRGFADIPAIHDILGEDQSRVFFREAYANLDEILEGVESDDLRLEVQKIMSMLAACYGTQQQRQDLDLND